MNLAPEPAAHEPEPRPDSAPTEPPQKPRPPGRRPGPTALVAPMRRALRVGAVASLIALPLSALVGYLLAGGPGLWGALTGMGIAVAFFAITVVVALSTAGLDVSTLGIAVLGSWLVKMVLLILVLVVLRDADYYSRPALFLALLVGTIGSLVLEALVVLRTQVPYLEPERQ